MDPCTQALYNEVVAVCREREDMQFYEVVAKV